MCHNVKVGISENYVVYRPKMSMNVIDNIICNNTDLLMNHTLLNAFTTGQLQMNFYFPKYINIDEKLDNVSLDFIGLNHYNECLVSFSPIE